MKVTNLNEAPEYQGEREVYGFSVSQILHALRTLSLEVDCAERSNRMFRSVTDEALELSEKINKLNEAAIVKNVVEKEKKGLIKSKTYVITEDEFTRVS